MGYDFVRNGCECGYKRYNWTSLGRTQSGQASLAIDELGRLFSWGQNAYGQAGHGDRTISEVMRYIEWATQLGTMRNWLKASCNEFGSRALNDRGEIWGWGWGSEDCSAMGLPIGSGGGGSNEYFYIPTLCTPGYTWKDYACDMYCMLMVDMDGQLYSCGDNFDYNLGMGIDNNIYNTPQINPTLTDPIKLIDAEYLAKCAVTEDDEVYIWAEWWCPPSTILSVPTLVTGLPVGSVIVALSACEYGTAVILSDGTVWAFGDGAMFGDNYVAYPAGTSAFQQVTGLSSYNITKINVGGLGGFNFFALDEDGNIWGTADGSDSYWHGKSSGPANPLIWSMVAVEFEGERKYVDMLGNQHQGAYQAIDDQGYLHTWGYQGWGPHLAIGAAGSQYDIDTYDPNIEYVVRTRTLVGLAGEAIEGDGDPAYLNNLPTGESPYIGGT